MGTVGWTLVCSTSRARARRGLVSREQHGSSVFYQISDPIVDELCELVCNSIARRFDRTEAARRAINGYVADSK